MAGKSRERKRPTSALGQTLSCESHGCMTAFPLKAEVHSRSCYVAKVPSPDITADASPSGRPRYTLPPTRDFVTCNLSGKRLDDYEFFPAPNGDADGRRLEAADCRGRPGGRHSIRDQGTTETQSRYDTCSGRMRFSMTPTPSISQHTKSAGCRNRCGFMK